MIQLDQLDRKILHELDADSRQSYAKIAKKTRSNKDTVKYRIEKLIENEIIEGFYTVIDYTKLGFISFRFYVQISDMPVSKKEELIDYLKNHENIWIFYRITGHYDFSFSIWVRNVWQYQKFWEEFTEKFGVYFLKYHLAVKTEYTEFTRGYLTEKDEHEKIGFKVLHEGETEALDKLDFKILNMLSRNARTSLVELAAKTKTSVVTAGARLKDLLKKRVIVGFRVMLNYKKLGYDYYKVDLWFSDMKQKKEVMNNILAHPNVIYTEKTLVTSDFEFDLEVEDFNNFIEIMDSFEKTFPDQIKRYEYYTLIKNYKVNYLPTI